LNGCSAFWRIVVIAVDNRDIRNWCHGRQQTELSLGNVFDVSSVHQLNYILVFWSPNLHNFSYDM
jgi:hypothetical protein